MKLYKSWKVSGIGEKQVWVVVDKNGNIVNDTLNEEELVGLEEVRFNKQKYTKRQIVQTIKRVYEEIGEVPTEVDFQNNPKLPDYGTILKYFGGLDNTLKEAGLLKKYYEQRHSYEIKRHKIYTDEELLKYFRQFCRENGRSPKVTDFECNLKYPCPSTYIKHFGSWNNALKMAGLWDKRDISRYTDKELLDELKRYENEYGNPPTCANLDNNHDYPSSKIYYDRFGSLEKAKKLIGQDLDSIVRKGIIETNGQKGRFAEINILENDEKGAIDLSGESCKSFVDGISKKSKEIYDVKSSKLHEDKYWRFMLDKYVDFYYLLGYDKDYKNLSHKWKVPGDFTDRKDLYIARYSHWRAEYNVENMKEYEIV